MQWIGKISIRRHEDGDGEVVHDVAVISEFFASSAG